MRSEFTSIESGFAKLAPVTNQAGSAVIVNAGGTAYTNISPGSANNVMVSNGTSFTSGLPSLNYCTNALTANVNLNGAGFFNGPTMNLGTTGRWLVSGHVTVQSPMSPTSYQGKLWDGNNVAASTTMQFTNNGQIHLSGFLVNPTNNVRIGVATSNNSAIMTWNSEGTGKSSVISAILVG